jgi:glucose/mannose transport system substrate-binding protein
MQAAGVAPLAQSTEPWQVATLFEGLVLADGGQALHRELFVRHERGVLRQTRVLHGSAAAVARPQVLGRSAAGGEALDDGMLQLLQRGEAAMMVMGDWAKGELNRAAGWIRVDEARGHCLADAGQRGIPPLQRGHA